MWGGAVRASYCAPFVCPLRVANARKFQRRNAVLACENQGETGKDALRRPMLYPNELRALAFIIRDLTLTASFALCPPPCAPFCGRSCSAGGVQKPL